MDRRQVVNIQREAPPPTASSSASSTALQAILANLRGIDAVWVALSGLYGHKFTTAYGEDPQGIQGLLWQAAIDDLSEDQLRHGLGRCLTRVDRWPPDAPEYRALCLDILSLAQVQADLKRVNEERHPFTRLVWSVLDTWAFTNGDEYRARDALRGAYEVAHQARMTGTPLPPTGQQALPKGRSQVERDKPNPAKMTKRGTAIVEAFARDLHPSRAQARLEPEDPAA